MGARTNYTIVTTDNPEQNINIYAHWDGDDSENILQYAIAKAKPRLDMGDISYATRIIIDQLTVDGRDRETGYGIYIGSEITHEEQYQYKSVDLLNKIVTIGDTEYSMDAWIAAIA